MLKVLNIKTTGEVSVIHKDGLTDLDVKTDYTDPSLPRSAQDAISVLISELQANNFNEIHMEETNGKSFTHKVGPNSFESFDSADHKLMQTLPSWGSKIETE